MSENQEFKIFIINELKENGYTGETEGKSIESLQEAHDFQKKLNSIKARKEPVKKEKETSLIKPINMSRENAAMFSEDIVEYFLKENAAFDERLINDQRFKINVKTTTPERPNLTMVLRDEEGRCF